MDVLPNIFWVARDSGSLVDLRIRAHPGGMGERVAHRLNLPQAQAIIRAVSAHDDLVATSTDFAKLIMVENFPTHDIAVHAAYERLRAALAKAGA